jgi:hypothetical protein
MAQPLTKSTGREEYGRSVERRPWPQGPLLGIFFTGPLGAIVGAVAGAIIGLLVPCHLAQR